MVLEKRGGTMKILRLFILMGVLLSVVSCSSTTTGDEERNPRENLEFFYNVEADEREEPERTKVYYYGEHYFKE